MFVPFVHKTQDEHQAEIAGWKQKNSELLKKMKAKVRGVEVTWPLLNPREFRGKGCES